MTATIGAATVGQRLGSVRRRLTIDELPDEVVEKLRCNVLHDLACAIAAYTAGPVDLAAGRRPRGRPRRRCSATAARSRPSTPRSPTRR